MFKKYKLNRAISRLIEDKLYELALNEVDKDILKRGTWARALSKSDGIHEKAKSIYLQYRVEAMKDEAQVIEAIINEINKEDKHKEVISTSTKKNIINTSPVNNRNATIKPVSTSKIRNVDYIDIDTILGKTLWTKKEIIDSIRSGLLRGAIKYGVWHIHSESIPQLNKKFNPVIEVEIIKKSTNATTVPNGLYFGYFLWKIILVMCALFALSFLIDVLLY